MENQAQTNPAPLLKTPLYDRHLALGARMVDFGGWSLPVQYTGIMEEHKAVRTHAGVFDVSHMGEIEVSGSQALVFLERLLTASLERLTPQRAVYSPMCHENGGTVDDLIVYQLSADNYLLVVNAANTEKDFEWIARQAEAHVSPHAVSVHNRSAAFAQLALQGPKAGELLAAIPELAPAADLRFFNFSWMDLESGLGVMVSRTGYTGEDGFEIYCPPQAVEDLFNRLVNAGAVPCGLGARDSLRFEAALPLYGHELEADITPREAGLDRFIDLDKGPFIGREALATPPVRRLVGLQVSGRAIPRAGYPVLFQGQSVGQVTSGMYAPTIGRGCAMALVDAAIADQTGDAAAGSGFAIEIRGRAEDAVRTPLPFYRRPR